MRSWRRRRRRARRALGIERCWSCSMARGFASRSLWGSIWRRSSLIKKRGARVLLAKGTRRGSCLLARMQKRRSLRGSIGDWSSNIQRQARWIRALSFCLGSGVASACDRCRTWCIGMVRSAPGARICIRTRFATRLPRTFLTEGQICGRFRACSAIRACRRRSDMHMSRSII